MSISIIIADDHPLVLDGLERLFVLQDGFEMLGRFSEGTVAMQAIRLQQPDVAVMDVRMPGMTGLEIADTIRNEHLPTKVVLFTAALAEEDLVQAVYIGIQGVVLKEMAPQLLLQCVQKVHRGEQWLERRTAKLALEKMIRREAGIKAVSNVLTAREIELVRLSASGKRNREIAEKLFISEGTVKVHLHNIYNKLDIDGRLGLMRYAQEKGLV